MATTGIKIYQDKKGEWRWQIKAGNHKIILASSEGFQRQFFAEKNLQLAKEALAVSEKIRLETADHNNKSLADRVKKLRDENYELEQSITAHRKTIKAQTDRADYWQGVVNTIKSWGFWGRLVFWLNPNRKL